jgi:hypothetical protein
MRSTTRVAAVLAVVVAVAPGLATSSAAEAPQEVRIVIDLEENGWGQGWAKLASGEFAMTGDLSDEGWAGGSIGWGARISLQGDAGTIQVDLELDGTWTVTEADGAYEGLTGGGTYSGTSAQTSGPWGWPLYAYHFVLDGSVELGPAVTESEPVTVLDPPLALTVTSITPGEMKAGSTLDVTVKGTGFPAGATLGFANGAGSMPKASNVAVVDASTIEATVMVATGGSRGSRYWDVVLKHPDGRTATLVRGLTVQK